DLVFDDSKTPFGDHSTTVYGATLAGGQAKAGLFGGLAVAGWKTDGIDETTKSLGAFGGLSVPLTTTMPDLEFCPVASFDHAWYPGGGGVDVSGNNFTIGGAFGRTFVASPTMDIVPFGDLRLVRVSISAAGSSASDKSGQLALGAGFIFSKRVSVR